MSTLWNPNLENYKKKMPTKEALNHSAVVIVKIDEAQVHLSDKTKSRAISFKVSNDECYANTTRLYFLNQKGEQIDFQAAKLDRLTYLLGISAVDFEPQKEEKEFNGKKYTVWTVSKIKNKEIGMFLEHKERKYKDDKGEEKTVIEFEIKDFFDPKTKKTSDEKYNEQEPLNYEFYKTKWQNAAAEAPKQEHKPAEQPSAPSNNNDEQTVDDDEFPF